MKKGIHIVRPNGKGLFDAIKNSEVSSFCNEIDFNSLKKFLHEQTVNRQRDLFFSGSQNTISLLEASIKGDDKKVKEIQDRITKERLERLERLYERLMDEYGDGMVSAFRHLDEAYQRRVEDYMWELKTIYLDDEWDSETYYVKMKHGLFRVYKVLSDETGYFTETEYVSDAKDCDEIVDEVNRVIKTLE